MRRVGRVQRKKERQRVLQMEALPMHRHRGVSKYGVCREE